VVSVQVIARPHQDLSKVLKLNAKSGAAL
jgi:microcompartment protein CcmL/EutN